MVPLRYIIKLNVELKKPPETFPNIKTAANKPIAIGKGSVDCNIHIKNT
jgi:hypothetical protein